MTIDLFCAGAALLVAGYALYQAFEIRGLKRWLDKQEARLAEAKATDRN